MSEINNEGSFTQMRNEMDVQNANTIASLKADLEAMTNQRDFFGSQITSWSNRWEGVRSALTEFFEEGTLNEGSPLDDYLIEEFDIETSEEVEVTVTAIWSGPITVKKGSDISDLDTSDSVPYELSVELDGETFELRQDSVDTDY